MRKSLLFSSRLVKSKKCKGGEGGFIFEHPSPEKMKLSTAVQCGGGGVVVAAALKIEALSLAQN